MDVQPIAQPLEPMKQMLAVRLDAGQHPPVEQRRAVGEPTLRAARPDDPAEEEPSVLDRDPMQRVTFGHSTPPGLRRDAVHRMLTAMDQGENGARGDEGGAEPTGETTGSGKPFGHSGLVGAGNSRVGISGAMRARDVSRVRPEDLAEAEREVRIRHAAPIGGQAAGPPTSSERTGRPSSAPPAARPARAGQPKAGAPVPAPPPRRDRHAGGT